MFNAIVIVMIIIIIAIVVAIIIIIIVVNAGQRVRQVTCPGGGVRSPAPLIWPISVLVLS